MWPTPSAPEHFVARRQQFLKRLSTPAALGSGLRRVRNFEANQFPFRADSHFLYFVGAQLEGAVLHFSDEGPCLFVDPPDPAERLWHGDAPTLEQLETQLQLRVLPLDEFEPDADTAAVPSADSDSALWLEELLGRTIELDPDLIGMPAVELEPEEHGDELLARALVKQRLCHDDAALDQIRQAVEVTVAAHRASVVGLARAKRAASVRALLEAQMTRCGMTRAYGSIVTPSGHILHARSATEQLNPTDWLLVDAGAETPEGWAADVTRTWPVNGRFEGLAAELYAAVLSAQQAAIDMCRVGVRFIEVHRAANRELTKQLIDVGVFRGDVDNLIQSGACAAVFPHGIGHLLGLDVHDMEDLGDRAGYPEGRGRSTNLSERFLRLDRVLAPGMVVTIEPGIYNIVALLDEGPVSRALDDALVRKDEFQQFCGIRIEDDVLITDSDPVVLTQSLPKKPEEVAQLLRDG